MIYDIAIIGCGPGGGSAAEYAGYKGLNVVCFEPGTMGGSCLREGCVPSKVFLKATHDLYRDAHDVREYLSGVERDFSMKALQEYKQQIVEDFEKGIKQSYKDAGIEIVRQAVTIEGKDDNGYIVVKTRGDEKSYKAKDLVIATGSTPNIPQIEGIESGEYMISNDMLELTALPESITILGGGVIAVEAASFFISAGIDVTLVHRGDRVLKNMDHALGDAILDQLKEQGVEVLLNAEVTRINGSDISYKYKGKEHVKKNERLMLAFGRNPLSSDLGLERLNIKTRKRAILVDEHMRTNVPHVYAVGDVIGHHPLAHTARREAQVVIHHILGISDEMSYEANPIVVYTYTEAAGVGMTSEQVAEDKRKAAFYETFYVPMAYAGRHMIEFGDDTGFVKIITKGKRRRIVGGHIFAHLASEYITPIAMAIAQRMTIDDLSRIIFPHPSVIEVIHHAIYPPQKIKN